MPNSDYFITKITIDDLDALIEISKKTFIAFFKEFNSDENLNNYVNKAFTTTKIHTEITNTNSEFYFAKHKNEIIGYLKLNLKTAQTELQDPSSLEIERIYVVENFIGKQVGQLLMKTAIESALNKNLKYIWLGVWEHNLRAIQFYQKHNFAIFDTHIFKMGNDDQTDYLMKLKL